MSRPKDRSRGIERPVRPAPRVPYGQPRPALTRTPTDDKENLKTYAAFVQDQVALTERLRVLTGARFERFEHDYETFVPGGRSWQASDNAVTLRAGVTYDLTDTVAIYADTARSFKPVVQHRPGPVTGTPCSGHWALSSRMALVPAQIGAVITVFKKRHVGVGDK
ncbi:putative tonB-dependent siderophore receptor [Pseudomonas fluorescens]|uniref:Putative tonB-dependent siderophore receptor n=1 Tax=Pseudomonas fluorescens TaxID=294 RepID=A0A0P9B0J6_PSEFL|nr:putative tonB-dependent siderophore receptor [Pseudomonas fluorescens]